MRFLMVLVAAIAASAAAFADEILIQSTTSTQNSGLYDHLLPRLEAATGVTARVVAVGTGQAIKNAAQCDGDILLVHAKAAEEKFVAEGGGVERFDLMYNDFVIVGPGVDPAGLAAATSAADAMTRLAGAQALFASRGDDSGTHKKELALWRAAGVDPTAASGGWYRETGSGMGATLNASLGMGAYTLADRASWVAFGNKGDHKILFEGDAALFNQYGVILVSPKACPSVKVEPAQKVIDWLLSADGQAAIADFKVSGLQLFFPNAGR